MDPGLAVNAVRESLRYGFGSAISGVPRFALQEMSCMIEPVLEFTSDGTKLLEKEIEWAPIGILTR